MMLCIHCRWYSLMFFLLKLSILMAINITIIIITIIIAINLIPQQPVNVGTEVEFMSVISSCLAQKQPRPSSKKNWFISLIITSKLLLINIRMNYECHSERATALLVKMTSRQRKRRAGENQQCPRFHAHLSRLRIEVSAAEGRIFGMKNNFCGTVQ